MKWLSIDTLNNDDNYVKSERSIQYIILIKLFVIFNEEVLHNQYFPSLPLTQRIFKLYPMNIRFGRMSTTDLFPYSLTIY